MRTLTFALILFVGLLAACGPQPSPAPTAFSMPTLAYFETPLATPTPAPTEPEQTEVAIATAPGTATPTGTPPDTATPTVTFTPSETITDTPTLTPSDTPTPTATTRAISGLEGLAILAQQATILPSDFEVEGTRVVPDGEDAPLGGTPSSLMSIFEFLGEESFLRGAPSPVPSNFSSVANCESSAPGGFGSLEAQDPSVRATIGCPLGNPPPANSASSAYQTFQNGFMLWVENPGGRGTIYVMSDNGTYQTYTDTWNPDTDPERTGETPPSPELSEPIRGFGKVWRANPAVRDALGWATGGESGNTVTFTEYERGVLLFAPQRGETLALTNEGTWRSYETGF